MKGDALKKQQISCHVSCLVQLYFNDLSCMYEMARMVLFLVAERGMQIANIATGMRRLEVGKMG